MCFAHGGRLITRGFPVTVCTPREVELAERTAKALYGEGAWMTMPSPMMGAEDFSFYGDVVPACFFALGLGRTEDPCPPLHDPTFDFRDDAIATGVETMVHLALAPLET